MMYYLINPNVEILNNNDAFFISLENEYYYINEVSYSILDVCKKATTFDAIVSYILEHYNIEKQIVEDDVKKVLQNFLSHDILIVRGDRDEKNEKDEKI